MPWPHFNSSRFRGGPGICRSDADGDIWNSDLAGLVPRDGRHGIGGDGAGVGSGAGEPSATTGFSEAATAAAWGVSSATFGAAATASLLGTGAASAEAGPASRAATRSLVRAATNAGCVVGLALDRAGAASITT